MQTRTKAKKGSKDVSGHVMRAYETYEVAHGASLLVSHVTPLCNHNEEAMVVLIVFACTSAQPAGVDDFLSVQ